MDFLFREKGGDRARIRKRRTGSNLREYKISVRQCLVFREYGELY